MPIINMYRGDAIAVVDSDHIPTYENFLANGWTVEKDAPKVTEPTPAPEALEKTADPSPEAPVAAPKGRKAR